MLTESSLNGLSSRLTSSPSERPGLLTKASISFIWLSFTMDVYSHIIDGMQQDAMMLLDGVLPKAKSGVSQKK